MFGGTGHVRRTAALLSVALLLAGCASSRPANDVEFGSVGALADLNGRYANRGEVGEGVPPVYLSSIIWPEDENLDHTAIDEIEIVATSERTLRATALTGTGVTRESDFNAGRDFEMDSGRLRLNLGARVAGSRADEPILGIHTRSVELGLDEHGDGRMRGHDMILGLAYAVFPVAASEDRVVRFVRVGMPRPAAESIEVPE
jgi:hypothetical protein